MTAPGNHAIDPHELEFDLEVERLIAALEIADVNDIEYLSALTANTSSAVAYEVVKRGNPLVREKLLAPTMARAEREGLVEWTGTYGANGQKLYKSLVYDGHEN